MRETRIFVLCQDRKDGTSWWRAAGPLAELSRVQRLTSERVTLHVWDRGIEECPTWADLAQNDILFAQRPYTAGALGLIRLAKRLGLKIWVEHDDDLINVPLSNSFYRISSEPGHRQRVANCLAEADVVTVSTEPLKTLFGGIGKQIHVVPNAYPDFLYQRPSPDRKDTKRILWRGSRSHDSDLFDFIEPMARIANEHPDWKWMFVGKPYWVVYDKMPRNRTLLVDPMELPKYFSYLASTESEIGIIPLSDNEFNKSKSNIGWQEMLPSGAAILGPDWDHWRQPGTTLYKDQKSFYEGLKKLIGSHSLRRSNNILGLEALEANFLLSKVNQQRMGIIRELMGCSDTLKP